VPAMHHDLWCRRSLDVDNDRGLSGVSARGWGDRLGWSGGRQRRENRFRCHDCVDPDLGVCHPKDSTSLFVFDGKELPLPTSESRGYPRENVPHAVQPLFICSERGRSTSTSIKDNSCAGQIEYAGYPFWTPGE